MPKYWGKQIFSLGRFPEVGQKQKTEKKERPKVANNNGQLRITMPPWVALTKPPGPKCSILLLLCLFIFLLSNLPILLFQCRLSASKSVHQLVCLNYTLNLLENFSLLGTALLH